MRSRSVLLFVPFPHEGEGAERAFASEAGRGRERPRSGRPDDKLRDRLGSPLPGLQGKRGKGKPLRSRGAPSDRVHVPHAQSAKGQGPRAKRRAQG